MKRKTFYFIALGIFLLAGGFLAGRHQVMKIRVEEERGERNFAATRNNEQIQERVGKARRWTVEEDEPRVIELGEAQGFEAAVPVPGSGSRPFVELPEELTRFDRTLLEKRKVEKLSWKTGTAWQVESYYLRMDHPGKPTWTEKPIVWEFEVLGTETLGDEKVYVVEVYPEDLTGMPYNPGGKVYISTEKHTVVALKDRVLKAGVVEDRFVSFPDSGPGALSTLIPLELPPPTAKGSTWNDLGAFALEGPAPAAPKGSAKVSSGSDMMEVAFKSNGVTILQRWDSSHPDWPVFSSTPYRVSYLRKGS